MKRLCILLLTLASFLLPARGQDCKLAVYLNKRQGETVLTFKGIDNDRVAISNLLTRVLQIDPGIRASLFVQHDVEFHDFSDSILFLKGIGFQHIEGIGFSRQEDGLAIQFDVCNVEDLSAEIPLVDVTPTLEIQPVCAVSESCGRADRPSRASNDVLQPGETIWVCNAQHVVKTEDTEVRILADGTTTLPIIGAVRLAGLTIPEAERTVQDAYRVSGVYTHLQVRILRE